jgi:putative redox protein
VLKQLNNMPTSEVTYINPLGTLSKHLKSGKSFVTDAPVDNNGKGDAFSPTDTLATSLATCMLTIMGIVAEKNNFPFTEARALITKHMESNPRRVGKIEIEIEIKDKDLTDAQKKMLQIGALNCPVAKSLHPEIIQQVQFTYKT